MCEHLSDPQDGCCDCYDGKIVSGCLVESCRDASELLELGEAAFDQVTLGIEVFFDRGVVRARDGLLGMTAMARLSAISRRRGSAS